MAKVPETHGGTKLTHGGRLLLIQPEGKPPAYYIVENCCPNPDVANPAFNLYKADGSHYSVHQDKHGFHCDCGDHHWRRQQNREHCKHVAALLAVGLFIHEAR